MLKDLFGKMKTKSDDADFHNIGNMVDGGDSNNSHTGLQQAPLGGNPPPQNDAMQSLAPQQQQRVPEMNHEPRADVNIPDLTNNLAGGPRGNDKIDMLLEQVKQLIDINKTLNNKIKSVETNLDSTNSQLKSAQEQIVQSTSKIQLLEDNMHKFVGIMDNMLKGQEVTQNVAPAPDVPVVNPEPVQQPVMQPSNPIPEMNTPSLDPLENAQASLDESMKAQQSLTTPAGADSNPSENQDDAMFHVQDSLTGSLDDGSQEEVFNQQLGVVQAEKEESLPGGNTLMQSLAQAQDSPNVQVPDDTVMTQKQDFSPGVPASNPSVQADPNHPLLKRVLPGSEFAFQNGSKASNIMELLNALKTISDAEFNIHVNPTKNDFATWVSKCLNNDILAQEMLKQGNRPGMVQLIEAFM